MKLWLYGILVMAVLADLGSYRIPNHLIAFGLCVGTLTLGVHNDALTFVTCIAKVILFAIAVFPLYQIRALGAGDVKLLVVVSLILGVWGSTLILVTSVLAGSVAGLIKLAYTIVRKRINGEKYLCHIISDIKQGKGIAALGKTKIHFSLYILLGTFYYLEVHR